MTPLDKARVCEAAVNEIRSQGWFRAQTSGIRPAIGNSEDNVCMMAALAISRKALNLEMSARELADIAGFDGIFVGIRFNDNCDSAAEVIDHLNQRKTHWELEAFNAIA